LAKVSASELAAKWGKRLKGATEEMRSGADKVTTAPSALAVNKSEKMKANLIKAIEDGVWAKELAKYSLEDWKEDFKNKGVPRISAGVDSALPDMEKFAGWLLGRIDTGQSTIAKMPDGSLDEKIARMETFVRHMAKERYKGK